jgi:hypothetical protein
MERGIRGYRREGLLYIRGKGSEVFRQRFLGRVGSFLNLNNILFGLRDASVFTVL